jgi:hypothetical protein
MVDPGQIDFSYTVFWTRQARQWDQPRRASVQAALKTVLARPDFLNNAFARTYTVPGLDDQAHAGASLLALDKVLDAFHDER